MASPTQSVTVRFTKSELAELDRLAIEFDETRSKIIRRALILLTYSTFKNSNENVANRDIFIKTFKKIFYK